MDFDTTKSTILASTAVADISAIDKDSFQVGNVVAGQVGTLAIRLDTAAASGQDLNDLPVTLLDAVGNECLEAGCNALITKASADTNLVGFTDPDMGAMPSFFSSKFEKVALIFNGTAWYYVG